jgi:rhamnosyltransferase
VSVWAVIAHYGEPAATLATIASLRAGSLQPDEILIVDNQGNFPQEGVRVATPGRNLGFAGAIALGASEALRAGAEWVWFPDNDAKVAPSCLQALLAAGDAAPRAGLLTPVIEHEEGGIWYAGGTVDARRMAVRHEIVVASQDAYDTGYATGCAVLARAAFLLDTGPADEDLFMYFEDVEWSLRARARGWRVVVVPSARVRHSVALRRGRRVWSPTAVYLLTRNRLLLARRAGGIGPALAPAVSWGLRQWLKGLAWRDGGRTRRAFFAGLRDGIRGRGGPPPTGFAGRRP